MLCGAVVPMKRRSCFVLPQMRSALVASIRTANVVRFRLDGVGGSEEMVLGVPLRWTYRRGSGASVAEGMLRQCRRAWRTAVDI